MDLDIWWVFAAACVLFSIAPGAGMVNTINNTVTRGFSTSMQGVLGLQLAMSLHLLLVSVGLGSLLATSAFLFEVVKYVGAAYLIYLGIKKFREVSAFHAEGDASNHHKNAISQGFWVNLSNPKSIVFLAAFLPQFVSLEHSLVVQYALLGITVVVIDSVVMLGYTLIGLTVKPYLTSESVMSKVNKLFGAGFIGMGLALARSER